MSKLTFVLGKGTICKVAMPPLGGSVEPDELTLTTGATSSAQNPAVATITLSAAIPANKQTIPAGSFVGFKDQTTGKVVVVQLHSDASSGDTTISVENIPESIAAGSVAEYPLRLSGRTNADIGRDGNRTESVDFDSDGYASGLTTSIAQTIEMQGNYLPQDAGFATAEYAFRKMREIYVWVELPKSSANYSKGKIYKGFCSIDSLPLGIPADGIITGNISLSVNGEMDIIPEKPVTQTVLSQPSGTPTPVPSNTP